MTAEASAGAMFCRYCGGSAVLKLPSEIGKPGDAHLYVCSNYPSCDAYVRCHAGTTQPLGTLARKRLRRLRTLCHQEFDPLWQSHAGAVTRAEVYEAAGLVMHQGGEFHIGHLDEAGCERFLLAMPLIEQELDRQILLRRGKTAGPSPLYLDVLSSLFDPNGDQVQRSIPASAVMRYPDAWTEAQRCGLLIQEGDRVSLSPRGQHELQQWGKKSG